MIFTIIFGSFLMKWAYFIFIGSMIFTVLCIILFITIPGFPLFIFFFLPPIYCWGYKAQSDSDSYSVPKCPHCGKALLYGKTRFCPHCGKAL